MKLFRCIVLASLLALLVPATASAGTGACGAAYIAPAVSSYSAAATDDGSMISSANATGPVAGWAAASLSVNLPAMSGISSPWSICGFTDGNNAVVFNAPALAAPATPVLSATTGGSIGATTYYAKITYINVAGETVGSTEASLAAGANHLLVIATPGAAGNATAYNVYVATGSGIETKQNVSPIALSSNWTEPVGGLIAGATPPSSGTAPAAYILDGGQQLATYIVGTGNYQTVSLSTDGSNYRVTTASNESRRINGATSTFPNRWVYPGGPGYQATQGDNGNVISTDATSGGLAITLPSTTKIAAGWTTTVVATSEPGIIQVNGTSGGEIIQANAQTTSQLTFALGNTFLLMFDGANFRVYPLGASGPAIVPTNPMFGAKCDGVTDDSAAIQAALQYTQTNGLKLAFPTATCVIHTAITGNGGPVTIDWNNVTLKQTHSGTAITLTQSAIANSIIIYGSVNFVAADSSTASAGALNVSWPPVASWDQANFDFYGKINCVSTLSVVSSPYANTYHNCLTGIGWWQAHIAGLEYNAPLLSTFLPVPSTSGILIPADPGAVYAHPSEGLGIQNLIVYQADRGVSIEAYQEGTVIDEFQFVGDNYGVKVGDATINPAGAYTGSSGITPINNTVGNVLRLDGGECAVTISCVFGDATQHVETSKTHFYQTRSNGTDPYRGVVLTGNLADVEGLLGGSQGVFPNADTGVYILAGGWNRVRGLATNVVNGVIIGAGSQFSDVNISVGSAVTNPVVDDSGTNNNTSVYVSGNTTTVLGSYQITGSLTGTSNASGATPTAVITSWGIFDNIYNNSEVDYFNTSPAGNGTHTFSGISLGGSEFQVGTLASGGWTLPQNESYVGGKAVFGTPVQPSTGAVVTNVGYGGFAVAAMSKYVPHAVGVGCVDVISPVGGTGTEPSYCVTDTQVASATVSAAGTGGTTSTNTTLAQNGAIGQTIIPVAAITGFSSGNTVDVQLNSAGCTSPVSCFFETTIATAPSCSGSPSVCTMTLAAGLPLAASSGNKIFVAQTVTGSGGTGFAANYSVDIESGGIAQVLQVRGGDYTANPSGCAGTSCVQSVSGAGLGGSPALTINMGAEVLALNSAGSLTVLPPTASTTSTGAGVGAVISMAFANGPGTVNATGYFGNGSAGVSCPSGVTAGTVTVVAGIVTHC